jgi:hypothetical protein
MFLFWFLVFFASASVAQELRNKKYSYTCLAEKRDLCIGVSPGPKQVDENLPLQLKNKTNNELQGLDDEKMRSDFVYGSINGTLRYSKDPNFCYQRRGKGSDLYLMEGGCNTTRAFWNTTKFLDNALQIAPLIHVPTRLCATVMRCDIIKNAKLGIEFCDKTVNFPATELKHLQKSAMIRLWTCSPKFKLAQTFRQREDCVPGCDANLQDNDFCDSVCNTPLCGNDNGWCNSQSPTPPTRSPTNSPSTTPTANPSGNPSTTPTSNPSRNPTDHPTNNPTRIPSRAPSSSPSHRPSRSPSISPSTSPSISPTFHVPTSNPSRSPSSNPTKSPTTTLAAAAAVFPWWWIVIGVLLLCCFCCVVKQPKKKETHSGYEEEPDIEVLETVKYEETPPASPTPPVPLLVETPIYEVIYEVEELPKRVIRKEVDSTDKNYERTEEYKEVKGEIKKTVSFQRQKNIEYKEKDVPADKLDNVINELKSSLKKI